MNEHKIKDNSKAYKNIQRDICSKIRQAKDEHYKKKCEEIENL